MKKLTLLCSLLVFSALTGYSKEGVVTSNEEEKYAINSDGDAYFTKELSTTLPFSEICTKITQIISSNFVNTGAGIALNNQENIFMANYVFTAVQKAYPVTLDAWCVMMIEQENGQTKITLTLTNYRRYTNMAESYMRIADTQPLNPKGKKYGFARQSQLIDAFNVTCDRAVALIQKIELSTENQ